MKAQRVYKIGSFAFISLGVGHLTAYLASPATIDRLRVFEIMQKFTINLAGMESNLFLFHEGFSLMMGILLIGFGFLNFEIIRRYPNLILSDPLLILTNLIVSLVSFFISIKYFFLVPIIFTAISLISFVIVFGLTIKPSSRSSKTKNNGDNQLRR